MFRSVYAPSMRSSATIILIDCIIFIVILYSRSVSKFLINNTGVVYKRYRPAFAVHTSDGQETMRGVLTWPRAIVEVIVQSQEASSHGDLTGIGYKSYDINDTALRTQDTPFYLRHRPDLRNYWPVAAVRWLP